MTTDRTVPGSIDEYIAGFPAEVQRVLQEIRATIREAAPDAEEAISYGIPTFNLKGRYLIYFAGFKKHVSVYPAPMGVAEFADEMSIYGSGKGTMKFPLGKPVPLDFVRRIVEFRAKENLARAAAKA
ncbi:MAG TPA: DUF1801 domain-containing protein [Longimicrobium sp.]|nr:DUF1801 domain-containing protein [Longimicrobium sp.]